MIICIRYGIKYTLQCVLPVRGKRLQPRMWPFFMGCKPKDKDGEPIHLNRAFHVTLMVMQFVVASAAEVELGALYHNCQTGIIFRLTLAKNGTSTTKNDATTPQ
jgi:hypothetical protein